MHGDMTTNSRSNPYVLGFSIALCIGVAIVVSVLWFPWIWDEKYKQLRDFLFFSTIIFIVVIRRYGDRRRVPRFWLALSILAVAHSVGFWLFISRVRGLRPIEFILVTVIELLPAVFFINWFSRIPGGEGAEEH
jgi:hypothetical protein